MLKLNILSIISILILLLSKKKYIYKIGVGLSIIIFVYSVSMLIVLKPSLANLINNETGLWNYFNVSLNYSTSITGIGLIFIILSTLLIVICVLTSITIKYR